MSLIPTPADSAGAVLSLRADDQPNSAPLTVYPNADFSGTGVTSWTSGQSYYTADGIYLLTGVLVGGSRVTTEIRVGAVPSTGGSQVAGTFLAVTRPAGHTTGHIDWTAATVDESGGSGISVNGVNLVLDDEALYCFSLNISGVTGTDISDVAVNFVDNNSPTWGPTIYPGYALDGRFGCEATYRLSGENTVQIGLSAAGSDVAFGQIQLWVTKIVASFANPS